MNISILVSRRIGTVDLDDSQGYREQKSIELVHRREDNENILSILNELVEVVRVCTQ